jgi:hypothetical protein
MIPYEWRSGRIAIEIIGGSELATPTQAKVMMFGFPPSSWQVTRTTGVNKRALVGFKLFLAISSSKASLWFYNEPLKWVGNSLNYDFERSEVGASTLHSPHRSWPTKEKRLPEGPEPNIPKISLSFKIFSRRKNFALD